VDFYWIEFQDLEQIERIGQGSWPSPVMPLEEALACKEERLAIVVALERRCRAERIEHRALGGS
jgi:hypothetical protein